MIKVHGLKNCDSCRRARRWLDDNAIDHVFMDVREAPPSADTLSHWIYEVTTATLINRRSTTWRNLPAAERDDAFENDPVGLLVKHPTLIKRPVLETPQAVLVGFSEKTWADHT